MNSSKPDTCPVIEEETPILIMTNQQLPVTAISKDLPQPMQQAKVPPLDGTRDATPPMKAANQEKNLTSFTTNQQTENIQEQPESEEKAMRDRLQAVKKELALAKVEPAKKNKIYKSQRICTAEKKRRRLQNHPYQSLQHMMTTTSLKPRKRT